MADNISGLEIPACDVCGKPAVVEQAYSGRILCGEHLAKSVRKKVAKELRKQLILKKANIRQYSSLYPAAKILLLYWNYLLTY